MLTPNNRKRFFAHPMLLPGDIGLGKMVGCDIRVTLGAIPSDPKERGFHVGSNLLALPNPWLLCTHSSFKKPGGVTIGIVLLCGIEDTPTWALI